jgi:hypothetical protein
MFRARWILIIALSTIGWLCLANSLWAYVLQGGKWPQQSIGAPVSLTYSYQNMFDGGLKMPNGQPLPAELIRSSIEEALGLWAAVAPLSFIEVADDGLSYAQGSIQFGQIRFRHVYINGPDPPPPAQPVAKAQAYFPSSSAKLAGDVEYDHGDPWQKFGTLPTPDLLGATVHELGHTLGLGHTSNSAANMYWIFTRFDGPGTGKLHSDDIAGVRAIYGSGVGSVTPLFSAPEPATWLLVALAVVIWFARAPRSVLTSAKQVVELAGPVKDSQWVDRVGQYVVRDQVVALDEPTCSFAELRLLLADEGKLSE